MSVVIDGTKGTTTPGLYSNSTFTGTYTDGIVADYTTGLGRISVGASDGVAFYNGGVASTELGRFDASGNLLVGTASTLLSGLSAFVNSTASTGIGQLAFRNSTSTAGKYYEIGATNDASPYFVVKNQDGTGVYISPGGNSWTGTSDETQKTDLIPIENAANKVSTLRAVTGRFITDEEGTSRSFLIAQDVQKVLPEAVCTLPEGHLGLAYTDVIPLLVAAIQELNAKVDALQAQVNNGNS